MTNQTQQNGFSLIEVCVALVVGSVLLAMALPAMEQLKQRQRLQALAQTMAADLQFARSTAVTNGSSVQFRFTAVAGGSCYLIYTGGTAACRCEDGGKAVCTPAGQVLKRGWVPSSEKMAVTANVPLMHFQARQGAVTSTGSVDISADSGQAIRHRVSITGRVRSCSPSGSLAGLPTCSA